MKKIIIGILIGIIIGLILSLLPNIRYDTNRDGKINIADVVKEVNYITKN